VGVTAAPESRIRSTSCRVSRDGVVLVTLVAAAGTMLGRRADPPVLAVGDVRSGDSALSPLAIGALPELLATDLARVGGLRVISHPRLEEVAAQLEPARRSAITIARAAGASVLLEGELYRRRDSLRLDLRQVDAKTGVVQNALTLRGRDVFALADSATQWFAGRYHLDAPGGAIAAATSASLVAHGLYNEGLRAYYRDADVRAAERLFRAALDQDSTFAMAAYYLARTLDAQELPSSGAAFERAARLAANSPAREALFIRVWWAAAQNDPAWPVLAESLAARYPDEPDAQYAVGRGRSMSNNYFGAVAPLRAAIRQDSLSLSAATATRCVACDAYYALIATYVSLDSVPAAEAVARDWVRRQPRSAIARDVLRDMLDRQERYAEADDLTRTVAQLSGAARPSYLTRVSRAVRAGDWATADQLVAVDGTDTTTDERQWWRIITLRYEGRPRAAAAEASARLRAVRDRTVRPLGFLPVGAALFEAGDLPGAAAAFDSAAWASPEQRREYPGVAARHIAWACNLHATVAAAQGDTALLRILADSVAFYGPRSALGRDRMLPGYIHGLLLELQGNPRAAIDSFHAAAFSPTEGFTRVNLELARSLVRLGRPRDAIGWLEAALRGGIEGSNFYVTRPALRDELGRIFAAMGQVDSARTQFALVARAWAQAEPPYSARRDSALAYLARTARRRD
jgi:TolB-like protein